MKKMKILLLSVSLISTSFLYAGNDNLTNINKESKIEKKFEYLKFNVNDFMKKDSIKELPDDKLKYLKFDVNKYIKEDKENN